MAKLKIIFFLLLAALFLFGLASTLHADAAEHSLAEYHLDAQDKSMLALSSVCYIATTYYGRVYDPIIEDYSDPLSHSAMMGAGFVVNANTGHIVTASHVIEGFEDIEQSLIYSYIYEQYPDQYFEIVEAMYADSPKYLFRAEGITGIQPQKVIWVQFDAVSFDQPPEDPPPAYMKAELVHQSPWQEQDITILQVQPMLDRQLTGLTIAGDLRPEIGDTITVLGYLLTAEDETEVSPSGILATIQAQKQVGQAERFQVQSLETWCYNGGPILDENGDMVGMFTLAFDEDATLMIPASEISQVLSLNDIASEPGKAGEHFTQGLALYRMGHFSEALKNFNTVLGLNQGHLKAQEYRQRSLDAIEQGEDSPYTGQGNLSGDLPQEPEEPSIPYATLTQEEIAEIMESIRPSDSGTPRAQAGFPNVFLILLIAGGLLLVMAIIAAVLIIVLKNKKKATAPGPAQKSQKVQTKPVPKPAETAKPTVGPDASGDKRSKKYCSNCGNKVGPEEKFCASCGNHLF